MGEYEITFMNGEQEDCRTYMAETEADAIDELADELGYIPPVKNIVREE